jgi:hypothetical protein
LSQSGFAVRKDMPYTLTCWLRAPQATTSRPPEIGLNCMMAHEPWQRLGFSATARLEPEWKAYRFIFLAERDDPQARITLTGFQPGVYEIADISLRPGGIIGLQPEQRIEDDSVPVLQRGQMTLTEAARHDFIDFLWDTESEYWSGMHRFLKQDLGLRSLVSGTQLGYSPVAIQSRLDYIDAHSYWQHPRFPGRPWDPSDWYVNNVALVNSPGGTLGSLAARRVADLPYTVSEYNHPVPNAYAAEGFPMLAAVAGFQAWDGIYSFAYCHNTDFEPRRLSSYFDIKSDTAKLVHLPACAALFLRGDVAPAQQTLLAGVPEQAQRERLRATGDPWQLNTENFGVDPRNALLHRIAMTQEPADATAAGDPSAEGQDAQQRFVSDTGQLVWDTTESGAGYFTVDTPRTKLFTGFVRDRTFTIGDVTLQIGATCYDWATISLVCIDGPGFDQPGRLLIAATGAVQNRDAQLQELGGDRVTLGRQWGAEPVMCEGIPATITLPVASHRVTLYPLDEAGNRRAALEVQQRGGQSELVLGPQCRTVWYEVVVAE